MRVVSLLASFYFGGNHFDELLLFASLAAGYALSPYTGHLGAFLIVAAFYVLLAVVLISCKRVFIVNPIARFISRLMLEAPTQEQANDKPASVS